MRLGGALFAFRPREMSCLQPTIAHPQYWRDAAVGCLFTCSLPLESKSAGAR